MCIERCGSCLTCGAAIERLSVGKANGRWVRNGRRLLMASAVVGSALGLMTTAQASAMDDIVDIDGDIDGSQTNEVPGDCVDTDGDGYGWDGFDTCFPNGVDPQEQVEQEQSIEEQAEQERIEQEIVDYYADIEYDGRSTLQVIQDLPSLANVTFDFATSEKIYGGELFTINPDVEINIDFDQLDLPEPEPACIDNDRDGYGWNGTETCYVGGTRPAFLDQEPDPEVQAELEAFSSFYSQIDFSAMPSFESLDNIGQLDMFSGITLPPYTD